MSLQVDGSWSEYFALRSGVEDEEADDDAGAGEDNDEAGEDEDDSGLREDRVEALADDEKIWEGPLENDDERPSPIAELDDEPSPSEFEGAVSDGA